jgi:hypothetical protein
MKLSILLSALISNFATSVPNLCDEVFVDALGIPLTDDTGRTLSRYCAWTGPDAPIWDADVCCTIDDDGAACSRASSKRCPSGTKRWYCEHGVADALGGVTCYQPFPSACEAGFCVEAPEVPPVAQMADFILCCAGGACQYVTSDAAWDCQGELLACNFGQQNGDGTVDCWN